MTLREETRAIAEAWGIYPEAPNYPTRGRWYGPSYDDEEE